MFYVIQGKKGTRRMDGEIISCSTDSAMEDDQSRENWAALWSSKMLRRMYVFDHPQQGDQAILLASPVISVIQTKKNETYTAVTDPL